jgi:hypothetical protein
MRIFLTAFCVIALSMTAIAQDGADTTKPAETTPPAEETAPVTIDEASGPYVLGIGLQVGIASGGIATENAEGRKVNPDFWFLPTYGAVVYAPFSAGSKIGGRLDVGVNTTGTRTRPYEFYGGKSNWEGYFIERYTMFCIAPSINFAGLNVGVGFNFPMKAERWDPESSNPHHVIDQELLKSMAMDFRIGGMINVWSTKMGKLMVDISAKYYFSGLYNDNSYIYGTESDNVGIRLSDWETSKILNLTPASAHIGIAYLFNLGF